MQTIQIRFFSGKHNKSVLALCPRPFAIVLFLLIFIVLKRDTWTFHDYIVLYCIWVNYHGYGFLASVTIQFECKILALVPFCITFCVLCKYRLLTKYLPNRYLYNQKQRNVKTYFQQHILGIFMPI